MQTTLKVLSQSQVEVRVQSEQNDLTRAEQQAVAKVGRGITLKGFRPGMAPLAIIKQKVYGTKAFLEEYLHQIVSLAYVFVLKKHKLSVVGSPKIRLPQLEKEKNLLKVIKEFGYLEVVLTFSVWPKINLGDYKHIVREVRGSQKVEIAKTLKEAQLKASKAKKQAADKVGELLKKTPREQKQAQVEAILEALRENIKFDLPEVLIEQETKLRLQKAEENAQKMGLTLKDYLAARGDNLKNYQQRARLAAEEAIRTRLILEEIGKDMQRKVENTSDLEYIMDELLKM